MSDNQFGPVSNFLVPATGSTNAYTLRENFTATPKFFDPRNVGLDGAPFRPYGVIIDNTAGNDTLTVLVNEMSFTVNAEAGASVQMPFPAPVNCTFNITGDGDATVIFVDYPIIPTIARAGSDIPNPLPVTGPLTDAELRAAPVPVSLPAGGSRAAGLATVTTAGATPAGAYMVSFKNTGSTDVTVAGGTLAPGEIVTYQSNGSDTIGSVLYDATGGTLQIADLY